MHQTLISLAAIGILIAPVLTHAADASPEHSITGNLGLVSSYRFRGIDQTFGKPALQGGIDYAHSSGLYVGNWNSTVSSGAGYPDGNLEMDFYGGYKTSVGDVGLDFGAIVYHYPGSEGKVLGTNAATGAVTNKELYLGLSYGILSAKYYHSVDDYFALRGWDSTGTSTGQSTKGTHYLDLSATHDLGGGWGINGHIGLLKLKNGYKGDYTDWKIGVTKDVSGWLVAASYVGTDAAGRCSGATDYQFYCFSNSNAANGAGGINFGTKSKDAGRSTVVLSVSKSF